MADFRVIMWRCISASVAGTSHIARNLPCQDARLTVVLENGVLIAAVADGAGSVKRAQEGSRYAVESSVEHLANRLRSTQPTTLDECEALLEETVIAARSALHAMAPGEEFRELATTLLLTIVTADWLSTVQVGDGAVVCRLSSGAFSVLSERGQNEYVNETTFLTSSDYLAHIHRATLPGKDVSGFAMFTDGIELLALRYADNTAHEPFFGPLFEFVEKDSATEAELEEFLLSERVCERTDDDKTLLLAVRHDTH